MNCCRIVWLVVMALLWGGGGAAAIETKPGYNFQELYSLISSNLGGLSQEDLNRAAALGLVEQLRGRVELLGGPGGTNAEADLPIARTNVFEDAFGYIRLGAVSDGLGAQFGQTLENLLSSRKLKGLVLDLRFAAGTDFAAALEVVDYFAATEQTLLKWGGQTGRTKPKTNPVRVPLAVLINHQTVGAAEALAGMLRVAGLAYLVGSPTAGQARTYQEFTLTSGQKLRIGQTPVELGTGEMISDKGIAPDLFVETNPNGERDFLADPFGAPKPVAAVSAASSEKTLAARPVRRSINEAELVRRHREGLDPDSPLGAGPREGETPKTAVSDPSLGRALDFLKGLAVLQAKPN